MEVVRLRMPRQRMESTPKLFVVWFRSWGICPAWFWIFCYFVSGAGSYQHRDSRPRRRQDAHIGCWWSQRNFPFRQGLHEASDRFCRRFGVGAFHQMPLDIWTCVTNSWVTVPESLDEECFDAKYHWWRGTIAWSSKIGKMAILLVENTLESCMAVAIPDIWANRLPYRKCIIVVIGVSNYTNPHVYSDGRPTMKLPILHYKEIELCLSKWRDTQSTRFGYSFWLLQYQILNRLIRLKRRAG